MNRIYELSESTGTGNFTLNGAVPSTLRFSARIPLKLYIPYIIQSMDGSVWEKGKGYLSDANTLVRGYVLDNSEGSRNFINFGAGAKEVFYPVESRAYGADYFNGLVWKNTPTNIGYRSSMSMTANTLYFTPHLQTVAQRITGVGIKLTNPAAGARLKIALYNLVRQSESADYNSSFPLAFELGEVSGTSATEKIINTDFILPEGAYMFGVISTGNNYCIANSTTATTNQLYWETLCGDNVVSLAQTGVNIDALPQTTFGALNRATNQPTPCVGVRGYCL